MSILYGEELKVSVFEKENFSEYFFQTFKENPESNLLVDGITNKEYSRKYVLERTLRYVKVLQKLGLKEGDVVGLCSENSVEMAAIVFATLYLGLTLNPLNFLYSPSELKHMISVTGPKVIFCSSVVEMVLATINTPLIIVIGQQKKFAGKTTEELLAETASDPMPAIRKVDSSENVVAIFSSSGTTGPAKGVALSQRSYHYHHVNVKERLFTVPEPEIKLLAITPWFHVMGFFVLYYLPLAQIKTVFLSRFETKLFLSCIEKYQITSLILVPPIVVLLAKDSLVDQYNLSSLREIYAGAAPLQSDTEMAVYKRLPGIKAIRQGYGMSEGLSLTLPAIPSSDGVVKLKQGSVGSVPKGIDIKVIDVDTGMILGPNKPGELCFRGEQMMKGYYRNERATKEAFDEDGFLHSGDIGYYDTDGFFYIVDRLKELIKYNGYQVPPAELEAILLTHPKIKDAAVIGLPNEASGELPLAFVVKQEGVDVTEKEIQDFVATNVSNSKRLRGGVRFLEEIPKNASGKILRRVLRELVVKNGGKNKL